MKKVEKSSNKTSYKLIKYGAIMTGVLVISTAVGISQCATDEHDSNLFGKIINAIPPLGNKTEVIDINARLEENGYVSEYEKDDRYVKVNYNPDYQNIVIIDSDVIVKPINAHKALEEIKEYDNYKEANKIIWRIPEVDITQNEELQFEQQCDNISLYFIALQKINENNPLIDTDLVKYNKNFNSYLTSYNRHTEQLLVYEACVYQRLLNNDVDIVKAIDELNELLTNYANDPDYEVGLNDYPELVKGLNDGETLKDIYLPLAYDLHRITCPKTNDLKDNVFSGEELVKRY